MNATTGRKPVTIEKDMAVLILSKKKKKEGFIVAKNNVPEVYTSKFAKRKRRP
jgi:hypothetical protein